MPETLLIWGGGIQQHSSFFCNMNILFVIDLSNFGKFSSIMQFLTNQKSIVITTKLKFISWNESLANLLNRCLL